MGLARKYIHAIDSISEGMGWLSMMLVIVTIVIGFYNVAARYVGFYIGVQLSTNLFIELQWYLFSLVFFFGFPYILKHGINVRVDFLYANWSKKRQATIDFWGHMMFLTSFCVLGIWVTVNPVLRSWGRLPGGGWGPWELSPDPSGLPRAPIKSMIIVAFVILLLQTVAQLIKLYGAMQGKDDELVAELADSEAPLRIE